MPLWRQKEAAWQESLPPLERGRPRCPVNAMARARRSIARTVPPFAGKRACRRFAQTRRTCGRRARRRRRPCRRARVRRTARSPCRRAWADCPPRARRTHAPRAHPARRQGFSGYREIPTVCSKARKYTSPDMRRTTHDGRNLVYSPTLLKEYAWLSIMAAIWKFASRS